MRSNFRLGAQLLHKDTASIMTNHVDQAIQVMTLGVGVVGLLLFVIFQLL